MREEQVLSQIRRSTLDRGVALSVRELGAALGLRSPASVVYHLQNLERSGARSATDATGTRRLTCWKRPAATPPALRRCGRSLMPPPHGRAAPGRLPRRRRTAAGELHHRGGGARPGRPLRRHGAWRDGHRDHRRSSVAPVHRGSRTDNAPQRSTQ
ncbi:hypothetical protein [Streptomyces sp. NPDC051001]|uniref:LexA family protein n=1 Tax=Streptomyces sp. NPDC051001 TaxID=3155795 RepID=UPI00343079FD